MARSVVVVGGGVFGVTAALELNERGWDTTLIDPGPPHPLAASTDISKMIRADYGDDELYIDLMEACFPLWREWNDRWGEELYHEVGFLILAGGPMAPGGYEHTSAAALGERGYPLDVLDTTSIPARFPAWRGPADLGGYFNPVGGWAGSASVVGRLIEAARHAGVAVRPATVAGLTTSGTRVTGALTATGDAITGDVTVAAAGAWTPQLVPGLDDLVTTTGHPIKHFRPDTVERFIPPAFPPWAADIATTGWYGFPAIDGVVKVANHGPGVPIGPNEDRVVASEWDDLFRTFLRDWIPSLAEAQVVYTRLCLYTDTCDGDFVIDGHPDLENLVVSTGGSGHGFKFAPMLGALTADAVEDRENRFSDRFSWRAPAEQRTEAARGTYGPAHDL